jgi:hypothetical protein
MPLLKGGMLKIAAYLLTGALLLGSTNSCRDRQDIHSSFYYWKTSFSLTTQQSALLKEAAENQLYLRLFDVIWNAEAGAAIPNALLSADQIPGGLKICPVIYLTNKTFENTPPGAADSLASKVNQLTKRMAALHHFRYQRIQLDCDWTAGTRESYFNFLKALKRYSGKKLEVTIRLHQIKYPERSGVPPVDKGVLMFYNMGKISAGLQDHNSIYNPVDAEKYISFLAHYALPLDVALPVFSWAIHIRSGNVIQVYGQIGLNELNQKNNFKQLQPNIYQASKGFYMQGIYVKNGDVFKFEHIELHKLHQAAAQLAKYLPPLNNRNIIYYEISSNSFSSLSAKDIREVSDHLQ